MTWVEKIRWIREGHTAHISLWSFRWPNSVDGDCIQLACGRSARPRCAPEDADVERCPDCLAVATAISALVPPTPSTPKETPEQC